MAIRLYNTAVRRKETFKPLREGRVGMSLLAFESVGYPSGSSGLLLGIRLAGIDHKLSEKLLLRVDLCDLSIAMYRLGSPLPLYHPEHRLGGGIALMGISSTAVTPSDSR